MQSQADDSAPVRASARPRGEHGLSDMATLLTTPLVSAGFAHSSPAPHHSHHATNGAGKSAPGGGLSLVTALPVPAAIPAIPSVPTGLYARFGKRFLDLCVGVVSLLVAAPILLAAAAAVRLTSRGPALYRSTRLGQDGRPFTFYKLRSMYVGADAERAALMHLNEADGPVFKLRRDPRVTRVGQFLRSTSIDELPQLLNVIKGDMSLVGPRPPLPEEAERYEAWQRRRLDVKPGITCLWQVSGRSQLGFNEWMRLDLEYIRRQSLTTDLWILMRTIPAVVSREGAY